MTIQAIEAFLTTDGIIHADESKAEAHQQDLIGVSLDTLLAHDDRGNVTMCDRLNILTKMMDDEELKTKVATLAKHLGIL